MNLQREKEKDGGSEGEDKESAKGVTQRRKGGGCEQNAILKDGTVKRKKWR